MANKRSNGEGSAGWVTQNGIKYWRITLTTGYDPLTGNQIRKKIYGKTQKEAKDKLKSFLENSVSASDTTTLGNFYRDWAWNVRKQELKPSSFEKLEGIYRNYIKPNKGLNNIKLIDLDTLKLQKINNELLKEHTVSQVKTLNGYLKSCYKYAIATNKVRHNPLEGITYPKNHDVEEDKENYITESEQKLLVDALQGNSQEAIILLGLMCGLRLGEAMALQPKDLNYDIGVININKSVKYVWTGEHNPKTHKKIYEYRLSTTKTKKGVRDVPLPNKIIPLLKSLIHQNEENKKLYGELYFKGDLIFCNENGEYIDNKLPNRHLKTALKKAKIETDIHYHSLRHIFITNCVSRDVGLKTIMDWAGHSDTKTTMLIYAEVNREKNMKEYTKMNNLFD
jgi:integrase